ncbi:hypothetical protein BJV82DRAFT_581234 [Fennellomyces sp. T-0311]|nr:hypothetical protein BJV82DRAFT_581234 [Fennellomyces sp. T-0311]
MLQCSICKNFFSKTQLPTHEIDCFLETYSSIANRIPPEVLQYHTSQEFVQRHDSSFNGFSLEVVSLNEEDEYGYQHIPGFDYDYYYYDNQYYDPPEDSATTPTII